MPRALGYLAQCHLRFGPLRGTAPHSTASRFANTHRLLHLALAEGGPAQQAVLKEDLLAAYFLRAENVADQDVLRRTADKAGLSTARVDQVLASDEFADAVEHDIREAAALGATGVPFYVIDRRYGLAGAQSPETFVQVLERAWSEPRESTS